MMESYTSDTLPVATRASAWNTLYSSQLNKVEFTPHDRQGFSAQLSLGQLGPIQFARMATNRTTIERTRRHIVHGSPRLYSFLLQVSGSSQFSHCGQETKLSAGDFTLCDSYAPHNFDVEDDSTVIMLRVDAKTLKAHLPTPDKFCGLHLKSDVGLTGTMSAMVAKLHTQLESGFSSSFDQRFASHLLEMLSMSYAIGFEQQLDCSAVLRSRYSEVVRHVEDRLRDPQLSPATIAAGLRISPRYLRAVFATSGERASAYIVRRRLEECAKQIRNPAWAGNTLTEIAFAWGFNSAAHFTRTFHQHFGMTPRDYRRIGPN